MTVRSVELTAIEARRFSKITEKHPPIRIDHNSTVTHVRASPEGASIEFRYTATFSGVGIIRLDGTILIEADGGKLEAQWTQTNQMPPEIAGEVHTTVMRVCLPEAVGIARDLGLPPPIPLPQVRFDAPSNPAPPNPPPSPEVA